MAADWQRRRLLSCLNHPGVDLRCQPGLMAVGVKVYGRTAAVKPRAKRREIKAACSHVGPQVQFRDCQNYFGSQSG